MTPLRKLPGMLPYLAAMFLNAFVDLGHKIVIQNTIFKIYDGNMQVVLTAVVNAFILLPFILLFSPAGFLSDRFPKNVVMRTTAWFAVALTLLITLCYYQGWFWGAFAMTLLLGVQAALYSPAKYGYLKPLVGKERLAGGNGAVQSITIVAILGGTLLFSILFEQRFALFGGRSEADIVRAIAPLGWLLVICSAIELAMTYRLPKLESGTPELRFVAADYVRGRALRENLQPLRDRAVIRLSIIGLAVFWAVSQVMLAAFPAFAKETLGIHNTILMQGMLAASGIGIIIGSLLAGRFSQRHIETGLIPVGALGIALGLLWLPGLNSVLAHSLNFLFIGIMGGLFIVPLNALMQFHAGEHELGKILAANNLLQNIAMLGFLVVTAVVAVLGANTVGLLLMVAVVAVIGTGYTVLKLPQSLVRFALSFLLTRRYRLQVQGFKFIPERGGVLLLGNHISWIDWAIVQIASPRPIRFVMLQSIYQRWYLRRFFEAFGAIPISQGEGAQAALERVAQLLRDGAVVCLFPEGTISRSGHLATFRTGFERACAQLGEAAGEVVIVPFYLRGLWGSQFSRAGAPLKQARGNSLQRDIIVAFGAPLPSTTKADVLKRRVLDLSVLSWQRYVAEQPALPAVWLRSALQLPGRLAVADAGRVFSGSEYAALVLALAARMRRERASGNIGLLLPTDSLGAIANMAVLCAGRTVVNLNYTLPAAAFRQALDDAAIDTIYSAQPFIEELQQRGIAVDEWLAGRRVVLLDVAALVPGRASLLWRGALLRYLPAGLLCRLLLPRVDGEQPAAIVFSSGSEGAPKGAVLSHHNLLGNVRQIADVLNRESDDVVMATLPLFSAFGLTATVLLPLLEGMPVVLHPQPADPLAAARLIAEFHATIWFETSAGVQAYTRDAAIHPLMLASLRVVVSGGDKLHETARNAFKLKFNKDIFEGYGTTETAPVASVNLPDNLDPTYWQVQAGNKPGTVGLPLPGTSCKIVDPVSLAELPTAAEGLVLIGGCQVMLGYLRDNAIHATDAEGAAAIHEQDGVRWFRTGDKGWLDADGFLTLVDRYARIARVGGREVGLSAVESALVAALAPLELDVVAVAVPAADGGEKIVVLLAGESHGDDIQQRLQSGSIDPELIPAAIGLVETIPRLGSGKPDYAAARVLATGLVGSDA
jgi:acyl-[acyl-carrier-protein]-phospholipid O-acyltransferase/long-chain-fatty-acid--[acyl-carrier-protein] ligase